MTKQEKESTEIARTALLEILTPGQKVYTVLRHVSRSGMRRRIDVYAIKNNERIYLSGYMRNLGIARIGKEQGLIVDGCGMDMGFELVYRLGHKLWPDGFAPSTIGIRPIDGKRVNINIGRGANAGPMRREEMADHVANGWKFEEGGRNGDTSGWDTDGGYALRQEWL